MSRRQKQRLARIIIGAVIFGGAFFVNGWVQLGLYLAAYLLLGYDVVYKAVRNLIAGRLLDENFLMTVATIGAFCLGENTEAVLVMLLYQIGELFQSLAVEKSRKSISTLMDLRPDSAFVLRDGEIVRVAPEEVSVGEHIRVLPGERVPLDGVVAVGESSLDTAALTGESLPQDVSAGAVVRSGCINLSGELEIEVTQAYENSTVARILELVEKATDRKARTENFITRFSKIYTPVVVGAAVLVAVLPPLLAGEAFSVWIERALSFLVVSCPCALVISVPLSFFAGIGAALRRGILIKGSNYVEALSQAGIAAFDKTGTLTRGNLVVSGVHAHGVSMQELLEIAAAIESHSNHPIARSIVAATGEIRLAAEDVHEYPGEGLMAHIGGEEVYAGNLRLMARAGVTCHPAGGTSVYIARGGAYLGDIELSDEVKEDAQEAIARLKQMGVRKTVMLTGDAKKTGEAVAHKLGIDEAFTELLPEDKVAVCESLLAERGKETLVFIGDGINDAPVLARADVGVAMGGLGADAAIEAADVVIMTDHPSKLADAIRISKKTMRIARFNIAFAIVVKCVALLLVTIGLAPMWAAVFADVGVMVIAVLNALRALVDRK